MKVDNETMKLLGLSQDEIRQRVIDRICDQLMESQFDASRLAVKLNAAVQKRIDEAVQKIADRDILPRAKEYVEKVTLTPTNRWGELKGKALTFREYLADRAENYLTEQVNFEGKPKSEDSYNWRGTQTRITHMVHQHLHYSIETIMKNAVQMANSAISAGIQETVKLKLAEISAALQVSVKTK